MKRRVVLVTILLGLFSLCLSVISANAAGNAAVRYQIATVTLTFTPSLTSTYTLTSTIVSTATPVFNWNQPTAVTPTVALMFLTQTSQAQQAQTPATITPDPATPTPPETFLTATVTNETSSSPTPTIPSPIPTRSIVGVSRLLIKSERYNKINYWAIPIGLISLLTFVAILVITLNKRH